MAGLMVDVMGNLMAASKALRLAALKVALMAA
jgi:hypothetical protein